MSGADTSGKVAGMIWRADGQFTSTVIGRENIESHVCQEDPRVLPGNLKTQVSLAREVASLLAGRRDSFPAGSCTMFADGKASKYNDAELPISILDGHIVHIGDYSFDMLIDSDRTAQVALRGDAHGALAFSGESNTKGKFQMLITQYDGLINLQHISEDGKMLACGKQVEG
jgi:hypothetical protein